MTRCCLNCSRPIEPIAAWIASTERIEDHIADIGGWVAGYCCGLCQVIAVKTAVMDGSAWWLRRQQPSSNEARLVELGYTPREARRLAAEIADGALDVPGAKPEFGLDADGKPRVYALRFVDPCDRTADRTRNAIIDVELNRSEALELVHTLLRGFRDRMEDPGPVTVHAMVAGQLEETRDD